MHDPIQHPLKACDPSSSVQDADDPSHMGESAPSDLYERPIADEHSHEADYGERKPEPPEHMQPLPWATFQAFDPERHTTEDRWRVARALRDVLSDCYTPRQRREVIERAGVALDAAAALRTEGQRLEGPAFVLAILGLPADYYARIDAEEAAWASRPQKPCSCGWGEPEHIPTVDQDDDGLRAMLEQEPEVPSIPSYIQRMNDPARSPIDRAMARAVVDRPARYDDAHFDLALATTLEVIPPPELAEEDVKDFALAWLEAARRTPRDGLGNQWPEMISLAARVARGKHPIARDFAWRIVQHFFSTRYTYAFRAEDLLTGRLPRLAKAPNWPDLLAAAKALRPNAPKSDWRLVARRCVKCVGAPTVDDVVEAIDSIAGDPRRRTWQESFALNARSGARRPVIPRRIPGRCEQFHSRTINGQYVMEPCPNPATMTKQEDRSFVRHLCHDCHEFDRLLNERNRRTIAMWQAATAARREGMKPVKPKIPEWDC